MTPQPRRDKHGVPICPWPNGQVTCDKECKHLALTPLKRACFPALQQDYERMRAIEEERDDARVLVAAEKLKHIIAIAELQAIVDKLPKKLAPKNACEGMRDVTDKGATIKGKVGAPVEYPDIPVLDENLDLILDENTFNIPDLPDTDCMAKKEVELVPGCWGCPNKIVKDVEPGVTVFAGCKKTKKVKDYKDAKEHCPDFPEMLANRNKSERE